MIYLLIYVKYFKTHFSECIRTRTLSFCLSVLRVCSPYGSGQSLPREFRVRAPRSNLGKHPELFYQLLKWFSFLKWGFQIVICLKVFSRSVITRSFLQASIKKKSLYFRYLFHGFSTPEMNSFTLFLNMNLPKRKTSFNRVGHWV